MEIDFYILVPQVLGLKNYGHDTLTAYFSNNHLIPSNDNIEKLIKKIKENDYIKLKGYLVNAKTKKASTMDSFDSSISRVDTGGGACEVIYVTDITWLEKK